MKYRVEVMPKQTVLDPQGVAVESALKKLDFTMVSQVRIGKNIEIELSADAGDAAAAERAVRAMAEKLLCNANVEQYKVTAL